LELSNPKGSTVEYANAVVPQQDAIHRCPALIVLKEENNNNNKTHIFCVTRKIVHIAIRK